MMSEGRWIELKAGSRKVLRKRARLSKGGRGEKRTTRDVAWK